MKPPVRRFAAALVLPPAVAGILTALQARYGLPPWVPSIPPHITLVPPFTTRETPDELAARWEPVARRAAFPVLLDGFGRFDNARSVFFARVASNAPLAALADDALAAITRLHGYRRHPFIPHVALADAASRDVVDGYTARTADERLREEFVCDRFQMLCLDEAARRWDVLCEFLFS